MLFHDNHCLKIHFELIAEVRRAAITPPKKTEHSPTSAIENLKPYGINFFMRYQ